jgi:hypothetical protein
VIITSRMYTHTVTAREGTLVELRRALDEFEGLDMGKARRNPQFKYGMCVCVCVCVCVWGTQSTKYA